MTSRSQDWRTGQNWIHFALRTGRISSWWKEGVKENPMNKRVKKLKLNKDTLRNMDAVVLRRVAGGSDEGCGSVFISCQTSCRSCETCQGTACDTCFSILPQCTEACG